jgi:hypothetical protein
VAARATHGDATIIDEKSFDEKVIRFSRGHSALMPRADENGPEENGHVRPSTSVWHE